MTLMPDVMALTCTATILFTATFALLVYPAVGDDVSNRGIETGPLNAAIYLEPGGDSVSTLLNCEGSYPPPGSRISWTEFITNGNGNPISDGNQILNGPNSNRYSIDNNGTNTVYNLVINPTLLIDGGAYRCIDVNDASSPSYAQLVTILGPINCTTNFPDDGYVREYQYFTYECQLTYRGNVAPRAWWSGPSSGFGWATTTTNTTVWAGLSTNITRALNGSSFQLTFNFTEEGFIQPPFYASNVPTWSYVVETPTLTVQWGPQDMRYDPVQPSYEIGTEIYCSCDANPPANFYWQNMATNERWDGNVLFTYDPMIGTYPYRCHAQNIIGHNVYIADLFVNITVNPRPTLPPSTTPPTTTTAPPAWGECADLTGRWTATVPHRVDVCFDIDNNNGGQMIGLMRNDTDPIFIEIRGSVVPNEFGEIGFIGVWPVNIGTLSFVGVCSSCYGVESLWVTGVGRTVTDTDSCSNFGSTRQIASFEFRRTGPPCRNSDGKLAW